jgi:hypothetical protein
MLGQHPDLYGLPELKLFAYRTLAELDASLPSYAKAMGATHRSPGLVRAVAQLGFGRQVQETVVEAKAWLAERGAWSGAAIFDVVQSWVAPRRAVQKSPEDVDSAASLSRMSSSYPRACYIHLTRHPTTSIRSMCDHWARTVPGGTVPSLMQACIGTYVQTHRRILEFGRSVGEQRLLRVKAEEILNHSDVWLGTIVRWLSLDDGPQAIEAMKHPERSPFSTPGPPGSGVIGGNDAAFLRDPMPHPVMVPESLGPPTGWPDDHHWAQVRAVASALGY